MRVPVDRHATPRVRISTASPHTQRLPLYPPRLSRQTLLAHQLTVHRDFLAGSRQTCGTLAKRKGRGENQLIHQLARTVCLDTRTQENHAYQLALLANAHLGKDALEVAASSADADFNEQG